MARTQGGLGGMIWRAAVRNGLWGGKRNWTALFAVLATVKVVRRLAGSVQEVVYSEKLEPGQALVITHHGDLRLGDEPR
jgi:hypothetical protein